MMTTLFLDRRGLELRPDGSALALYENGVRLRSLPCGLIDRVVVQGDIALSAGALTGIVEGGSSLLFLSKRNSERIATVLGRPHADARVRLAQYAAVSQPDFRNRVARSWVRIKIRGQRQHLAAALRDQCGDRRKLLAAVERLDRCLEGLAATADLSCPVLLGIEGSASAAYFSALPTLFAPALGFTSRRRRPPPDPVNAVLSLVYTLLHHEAVSTAYAAGLDPYLGFLHAPAYGRESLACDLIEPLRPLADCWVRGLFDTRAVRAEHFKHDKGRCLLAKAGRARFYPAFENFAVDQRRHLRRLCRALVRSLRAVDPALASFSERETTTTPDGKAE